MQRLKDVAFTMPVLFVGIHAFYGLWTGLDHFFEHSDQNGNRALNGAICYVKIYVTCWSSTLGIVSKLPRKF